MYIFRLKMYIPSLKRKNFSFVTQNTAGACGDVPYARRCKKSPEPPSLGDPGKSYSTMTVFVV